MEGQNLVVFNSGEINQTQAHTEQKYFVETAEDPKKKKAKETRLVIIIVSVILILVAAIVAVLVVKNTEQAVEPETPVEEELTDFEKQKKRYEQLIAMAADEHERALVRIEYADFLIFEEYFEDGFTQLEQIQLGDLETVPEQQDYYAAYRNYYMMIGDGENYTRYNDAIKNLIIGSEYEYGG